MYLAEQPNMQGCKPKRREWRRRRSLSVWCSDWQQRGGDDASLPPWSLPRPSHDCYSRESTGLSGQTRHCTVSLYITSLLAASLSLPAVVTDSLVKPATDHRSGIEAGQTYDMPTDSTTLNSPLSHTLTSKRTVNSEHILYDIGYISWVWKFAQWLKF